MHFYSFLNSKRSNILGGQSLHEELTNLNKLSLDEAQLSSYWWPNQASGIPALISMSSFLCPCPTGSTNDHTIGWQNWNPLSHPNSTLTKQSQILKHHFINGLYLCRPLLSIWDYKNFNVERQNLGSLPLPPDCLHMYNPIWL